MAGKKEDYSIIRYCAKSLQPNISALKKSAQHILNRNDIEDIHDLRVASRRIRSVLDSFSDFLPGKKVKTWQKEIRNITKTYGAVRDLDVQVDLINSIYDLADEKSIHPGLRRVKLRLEQRRKTRQEKVAEETKSLLKSDVIADMRSWVDSTFQIIGQEDYFSSGLFQLGYKQIQNKLDEFLFYEVFIFDEQRVEELHSMRISAKQLRYSLEVFSHLYKKETDFALKISRQAQEILGNIHDCDVWIEYLPKLMEKEYVRIKEFYGYTRPYRRIRPGIEFFVQNRKEERTKLYRMFLKEWKNWKLKETWLNLRKVIFLTSLESQSRPPQTDLPFLKEEPPGIPTTDASLPKEKENNQSGTTQE